jgi:hypothetical protein
VPDDYYGAFTIDNPSTFATATYAIPDESKKMPKK